MSNIGMPPAWSRFGDGAAAGRGWGHESQPGGRMTTGTPRPFLARMVYTRHQPTGQMTVASVPDDTIPPFAFILSDWTGSYTSAYDAVGRVSSVVNPAGIAITYGSNATGQRTG